MLNFGWSLRKLMWIALLINVQASIAVRLVYLMSQYLVDITHRNVLMGQQTTGKLSCVKDEVCKAHS